MTPEQLLGRGATVAVDAVHGREDYRPTLGSEELGLALAVVPLITRGSLRHCARPSDYR